MSPRVARRRSGPGYATVAASAVFFAFTAAFGIGVHLISEFVGLGWHDDAEVVLSPRHGYLAVVALAAFVAFARALRAVPAASRRRRVAEIVAALPFAGRGVRFTGLSFVVQFAFFALTQLGEGCPLCGGDVVVGIVAAAAAALCGALVVTFAKGRVLELALELVWYASTARPPHAVPRRARGARRAGAASGRRTPFSFRYRPPPLTV